jgi:hypothetical protein
LANEIAVKLIANITSNTTGQEYEDAVKKGARYWEMVLAGRPSPASKEESDLALSRLLGCDAGISGRKLTWTDRILRGFS